MAVANVKCIVNRKNDIHDILPGPKEVTSASFLKSPLEPSFASSALQERNCSPPQLGSHGFSHFLNLVADGNWKMFFTVNPSKNDLAVRP